MMDVGWFPMLKNSSENAAFWKALYSRTVMSRDHLSCLDIVISKKNGCNEADQCPLSGRGSINLHNQIFCFMLQINRPTCKRSTLLYELGLMSSSVCETPLWENKQIKGQRTQIKPDKQLPGLTDVSAVVDSEGIDNITVFTFITGTFHDGCEQQM